MVTRSILAILVTLAIGIFTDASANPLGDVVVEDVVGRIVDDIMPRRPGRRARLLDLGERRADKFITNEHRFHVPRGSRRGIRAVVLEGTKHKVRIRRVEVVYRSGHVELLDGLSGTLRDGRRMRMRITPGRVVQVIVHATSPNLIGSRGKYRAMLRVRRNRL